MAGVCGSFGQTSDRLYQFIPVQPARFVHCSSLYQFRQQRPAGHGGNTSLGSKADFRHAPADDFHGQLQDVTTRRVLDLHRRVRFGDFARIARMLEVIENLSRIHATRL